MTCDRVRSRLDEYSDGELSGQDHEVVAAHVAGCAACSAELEMLERESALFAGYDRGVVPSPQFWDGVLARIADEESLPAAMPPFRESVFSRLGVWLSPSRLVPAAAACAAVVIAVAIGVTYLRPADRAAIAVGPQLVPAPAPIAVDTHVAPTDKPGDVPKVGWANHGEPRGNRVKPPVGAQHTADVAKLPAPVRLAERQYLEAIAALSKDVEGSKGGLDEKLKKPLADIDRNIVTAKQAVVKNPADTEAVMNMLAAYDQKVEVLQSLARYQVSRNR